MGTNTAMRWSALMAQDQTAVQHKPQGISAGSRDRTRGSDSRFHMHENIDPNAEISSPQPLRPPRYQWYSTTTLWILLLQQQSGLAAAEMGRNTSCWYAMWEGEGISLQSSSPVLQNLTHCRTYMTSHVPWSFHVTKWCVRQFARALLVPQICLSRPVLPT